MARREVPSETSALEFDLPREFTPADLAKLAFQAAEGLGLNITFEPGSQPVFHIHLGTRMARTNEGSTEFHDNSTGSTGAKSLGHESKATNSGVVTQTLNLTPNQAAELSTAFEELIVLVGKLRSGEASARGEAIEALKKAKDAVTESKPENITPFWEKAKGWLNAAMTCGLFKKAEQVSSIVARITNVLS